MKKVIISILCISGIFAGEPKTFTVDVENTSLRWHAEKVTGSHWGYVTMNEGTVTVDGKKIVSGEFSVDLTSMSNKDMSDSPWADKLMNHLKSDDFFDVENHPTATFKITDTKFKGGAFSIDGDITFRGITQPITFLAVVKFAKDGPSATGQLKIDRTLFGMKYRSGQFYPEIGDKMIYDEFTVDFDLKTK